MSVLLVCSIYIEFWLFTWLTPSLFKPLIMTCIELTIAVDEKGSNAFCLVTTETVVLERPYELCGGFCVWLCGLGSVAERVCVFSVV
jgi:hypothetical protein